MAWYIDSKNVKENKVETANEKYKKSGNQGKNHLLQESIAVSHVDMKI